MHGGLWLKKETTHLIHQNLPTQSYKKLKLESLELTLPTICFTVLVRDIMNIRIIFLKDGFDTLCS